MLKTALTVRVRGMAARPTEETVPAQAAVTLDGRRPLSLRGGAFAMLLVLLWGGQPSAIKAGLDEGAGPFALSAVRMALGGVVVIGYAMVTRTPLWPSRNEYRALVGLGILFVVQTMLMYVGADNTSSGHASVLIFSFPLWTAVLGHFFVPGDRMSARRTLGLLVAYAGVITVFVGGFSAPGATVWGDLMTVTSALLLAARQVYLSHFSQSIHPARLLMTQSVAAVLIFGAASLLFESGGLTWTTEFVIALLYQGVVIGGFGFIGNTFLVQRFFPSQVAATMLFAPIFGVIFSWLILGESLGYEVLVGVVLLVIGSSVVQLRRQPTT